MSRGFRLIAAVVALTLAVGLSLPGTVLAQREWQWIVPAPQGETLADVAYGGGQYVAVGRQGAILTSVDGADWSVRPMWSGDSDLLAVAYGHDRFVAVGEAGTLLTSVDGSTWVVRDSGTDKTLQQVVFGGSRFVALGTWAVLVSEDGLTWKQAGLPYAGPMLSVLYDGDRFVASGAGGVVLASPDGFAWTVLTKFGPELSQVAYGAGRYVGADAKGRLFLSADAVQWREQVSFGPGNTMALYHTGTHFVALGSNVAASADGETWQLSRGPGPTLAVARGKNAWVAVGAEGMIARSENGLVWAAEPRASVRKWQDVAFGAHSFVATDGRSILTSKNGAAWTEQWKNEDRLWLNVVLFGGGRFLVGSGQGAVLVSNDAQTWTESATGLASVAHAAWGNDRYVVAGTGRDSTETIATSKDGLTWKLAEGPPKIRLLAFGNGQFMAITDLGAVLASTDGVTWTEQAALGYKAAWSHSLVFGRGQFFLADHEGVVWSSPDGRDWSQSEAGFAMTGLVYLEQHLIALLPGGQLATSSDGAHWRIRQVGVSQVIRNMAYGDGRYVALATGGTLLLKTGPFADYRCGARFGDVPEHYPPCMAIELLESYRVINGYPDGTFRPHQNVSRAEFAKLLVVALGRETEPDTPILFPDAADHWAGRMGYLQAAVRMGALEGFPGGLLQPDGALTRAQAVKIAVAAAGFHASGEAGYADVTDTGWYTPYVAAARRMGLIGPEAGYGLWDGPVFRGDEPVTRAEAAMLLANLRSAAPVIIMDGH